MAWTQLKAHLNSSVLNGIKLSNQRMRGLLWGRRPTLAFHVQWACAPLWVGVTVDGRGGLKKNVFPCSPWLSAALNFAVLQLHWEVVPDGQWTGPPTTRVWGAATGRNKPLKSVPCGHVLESLTFAGVLENKLHVPECLTSESFLPRLLITWSCKYPWDHEYACFVRSKLSPSLWTSRCRAETITSSSMILLFVCFSYRDMPQSHSWVVSLACCALPFTSHEFWCNEHF